MSRCFGTPLNLSAKDYTYKKRNQEVFCDIRNKYKASWKAVGTNEACVNNNGIVVRYNSNSTMLNFDRAIENWNTDLRTNYTGQIYKETFCAPYTAPASNLDISNNYSTNGPILTVAASGSTAQTYVVDSSGQYINRYVEIKKQDSLNLDGSGNFVSGKQILYTKCPLRTGLLHQVILQSEVPAPLVSTINIVFGIF